MEFMENPLRGRGLADPPPPEMRAVRSDPARVMSLLARCPVHAPTPLLKRDRAATALGLGGLYLKDERGRMGLGSFKALGAAFAIARLADQRRGAALDQPGVAAEALEGETFVTASAGNHGLSVAAGARIFGATAVVYLPETAPMGFAGRLRDRGAEVVIKGADYEASMAAAADAAARSGWRLLSDSTWPGYDMGVEVMEGYLAMASEVPAQLPNPPSHVFLQAGVGGFAAAMAAHLRAAWGDGPKIIIVEPEAAPALLESVRAGAPVEVAGPTSNMGRLDCKVPSVAALHALARDADVFMTVSDESADAAVDFLMDDGLPTSPSAAAGVAGVMMARASGEAGLSREARALAVMTEAPADD